MLRKKSHRLFPPDFNVAHDLCFIVHDILVQFLVSGEQSSAFTQQIKFKDSSEATAFNASNDIFDWLESSGRVEERAGILKTTVLPAVLSDMLHCIYEALETSRKAKLNVTYILLRKPIQESLFLLESIVIDEVAFAANLSRNPLVLRGRTAGGLEAHTRRIALVLDTIGETNRFDAAYLAQLRYSKDPDGFDGICNLAVHLFTEHKAIRTEPLNINFIFSNWDAKLTQWAYLYSRMPYILTYTWQIVEHIGKGITQTQPEYLTDMFRRVAALIVLWDGKIPRRYLAPPLKKFIDETHRRLIEHCKAMGHRNPTERDLKRMATSGALPGETAKEVKLRLLAFKSLATLTHRKSEVDSE